MNIIFQAFKGHKTAYGYSIEMSLGTADPFPSRVVFVANMKELAAQFETYKQEAIDSGLPLKVSFMQHPRCKARKFPGFNKARSEKHFTPAFEAAAQ